MSTVSIAICTYNGAGFLLQQLDSLRSPHISHLLVED